MHKINAEHISAIMRLINKSPFFRLLSMEVKELGKGYSLLECKMHKKHLNPFGSVHGGVYSSLIDTAAYWAVYGDMKDNAGYVTIDLGMHVLAPIREGRLRIYGVKIKAGQSLCLAEAKIEAENGNVLAVGTSKMLVMKQKQTINHIARMSGTGQLPPKFI
jgi:uncharacterized protein (TIGR00369 family)